VKIAVGVSGQHVLQKEH